MQRNTEDHLFDVIHGYSTDPRYRDRAINTTHHKSDSSTPSSYINKSYYPPPSISKDSSLSSDFNKSYYPPPSISKDSSLSSNFNKSYYPPPSISKDSSLSSNFNKSSSSHSTPKDDYSTSSINFNKSHYPSRSTPKDDYSTSSSSFNKSHYPSRSTPKDDYSTSSSSFNKSLYSSRSTPKDDYSTSSSSFNKSLYSSRSTHKDDYLKQTRNSPHSLPNEKEFKGIRNICNTCFINSTLQVLLNLHQFISDVFNSIEQIDNDSYKYNSFLHAICLIFYKYISSSKGYIEINNFYDIIRERIPSLGDGGQHDVTEFFQYLAESCENEIHSFISESDYSHGKALFSKSQMLLYDPFMKNFGFTTISNVVCENCSRALTEEVQTNFILHVPFFSSRLEDCIAKSFSKEHIETMSNIRSDHNYYSRYYETREKSSSCGYTCKNCRNKTSFSLCSSLYRIPRFLIIQVERFNSSLIKNSSPINIPERINLQQYLNSKYFVGPDPITVRSRADIDQSKICKITDDDDMTTYMRTSRRIRGGQYSEDSPAVSEDEGLIRKTGYPNASYHLVSAILHEGSFHAGHYTAAINSPRSTSKWTVISDQIVMEDSRISSTSPYCFIYQID